MFFGGSVTPLTNLGSAILLESKRFPLVWDQLSTPLPTWRQLLPQSLDPRDAPWPGDENWLLKCAFSNNGDAVLHCDFPDARLWRKTRWHARLFPRQWVAQRRFHTIPISTPAGPMYPCIGIYTVDGNAVGIYSRIAPKPIIDYSAIDVATLIQL